MRTGRRNLRVVFRMIGVVLAVVAVSMAALELAPSA